MVDSICMSSYKAQLLGIDHQRIPNDAAQKPVIIGHEFYGEILEVGRTWADRYRKGQKFTIQPALNFEDGPGGSVIGTGIQLSIYRRGCNIHYIAPGANGTGLSAAVRYRCLFSNRVI